MSPFLVSHALVRPVPKSYDRCVRSNVERIDVALAEEQHAAYCSALKKLGLELVWVERDDALPDSCFVEDTAVVFGEKAVVCNMSVASRAGEVSRVSEALGKTRKIHRVKAPATIDGGDVLKIDRTVLVGLSSRTNAAAFLQLREILRGTSFEVVPVEVRGVLHLKSACTYLGSKWVILSEEHFDTSVLRGLNKIVVPRDEEYAADCLEVNGTILMAKGFPKTRKLLEQQGFRVEELDMSEFRKGEGALTCLSIIW